MAYKKIKYRIAIYIRLSKEDDKWKEESNSISMQRILLEKYVAESFADYELIEFCDDGYTGTNFDRPGVQEMLERVRDGEIDCIIVKDFSRFARDYIELGTYLEQIFPFMGVRFISVNDGYDSNNYQGSVADMDVNFRNLLYDLYSKDLSAKVRSALAIRKEKGQYVSGSCPFGYEKAPEDRHSLVIAEDEAEIVRRIFFMTVEGYTSGEIARIFNEERVKTPIEFKIEKGKTSRSPKGERFFWNSNTICQMLRNEVYIGNIVQKKFTKDFVGGRNHLNPREEWLVTCGHHEPIIEKSVFDKVQEGRGKKRTPQRHETHPLVGKLVCGCCRKSLRYHRGLNPYFTCIHRYSNTLKNCVRKVNGMYVEQYVLLMLQDRLGAGREQEQPYKETETRSDNGHREQERKREPSHKGTEIRPGSGCREHGSDQEQSSREAEVRPDNGLKEMEEQSRQLEGRIERLKEQSFEAYQDYVCGKAESFQADRTEIRLAEEELAELNVRIQERKAACPGMGTGRKRECAESQYAVLSKEMMDQYIDRIEVFDEQHMEIRWKEE